METEGMKKVIAIHDISGYGKCSLTVALPALSAMGVQCCPIPAAYLSTSTQYDGFTFHDMTDVILPALEHWKALGLSFAAVYSGFLGSREQMALVARAGELFPEALLAVDPVMGDDGRTYKTYTPDMCEAMTRLALSADVMFPNLTEASLILGRPYASAPKDPESAREWLLALSGGGARAVILTGLCVAEGEIGDGWQDQTGAGTAQLPFYGHAYHGTGDLFASVAVGCLSRGEPLERAAAAAARFVGLCAKRSYEAGDPPNGGVRFEELLGELAGGKP
jgi:pyridoxine kinase